jgi:hypothetical protein
MQDKTRVFLWGLVVGMVYVLAFVGGPTDA